MSANNDNENLCSINSHSIVETEKLHKLSSWELCEKQTENERKRYEIGF